jgi:streptogramin lyase
MQKGRGRERRQSGLMNRLALGLVLLTALASASAGAAYADAGDAELGGQSVSVELLGDTDAEAAQELPHDNLGREEAADLLQAVFEESLEAPAGIFDELEVKKFDSDHLAVIGAGGPNDGLLQSLLPLRAINEAGIKEPVGLDLIPSGRGNLEPSNPLVDVQIPAQLGEGIALPESSIEMSLTGAPPDRAPSVIDGGAAFFPNVAPDSDLTVVPTPTGVETFAHLRTSDAPLSQTYELNLPPGAVLEATPDGGAAVRGEAGSTLAVVRPPTAIDAAGTPVEVSMDVTGSSFTVSSRPVAANVYPILVDPLTESYWWLEGNHTNGIDQWVAESNSPKYEARSYGYGGAEKGLNVYSYAGSVAAEAMGKWVHRVPRWDSDYATYGTRPSSFIQSMSLSDIYFWREDGTSNTFPLVRMGLWDPVAKAYVSSAQHTGGDGNITDGWADFKNPNENVNVKSGVVSLQSDSSLESRSRHLLVGQATVVTSDNDYPKVPVAEATKWLNGTKSTSEDSIKFEASDLGLGVWSILVKAPKASGGTNQWEYLKGCSGYVREPCPRQWNGNFSGFNPQLIPQGENTAEIIGRDPVYHFSDQVGEQRLTKIKVDRTQPNVSVAGNLTEQASAGVKLSEYTLNYVASDGDDATAAALTPFGSKGTAPGQLERPQGVAVDTEGNVWVSDRVRNRIIAFDKSGKFLREIGVGGTADGQIKDPRGLAIAPNGNIWIAEVGNKRLQQFTPTGTFVSKITKTEFSEPWGIAVGPDGKIWVADSGSQKVFQFKADGTYIQNRDTTQIVPGGGVPYGIDTDTYGNAWIAMQSTNKVAEVDSNLTTIFSFGSQGSGPGQLNLPNDVAVSDSGNILVTDDLNSRVQVFKPDGSFLRQFGAAGSANSQFNQPRGIDVGLGNTAVIADASNSRVSRWEHADQAPQSGAAKLQIKVDGTTVVNNEPGCPAKNCAISSSWVLNADNYAVGPHKVDVIATDGVGLQTTKSLNVETHGDLLPPSIGLTGSMTEQTSLGTTRPSYKLIVKATDPGAAEERKSGVVSTSISVDGKVVDSSAPGCATEACSITREWTLNSGSYAVGSHTVQVVAKDGAGRQTTKSLTINIARDTTAPTMSYLAELYNAPSGWVEQNEYPIFAVVEDPKGYGVTSTQLKIDGTVVRSESASCPAGGCTQLFAMDKTVNMAPYGGGAHPAELIATDGAGNARIRKWTINVDPQGNISVSEATDTLEAVEETAPEAIESTPVNGLVTEVVGEEGSNPQLALEGGELTSLGTSTPSSVGVDPGDGFSIETTGLNETGAVHQASIEVAPVQTGAAATDAEITDGSAAVISNSSSNADTIIRPAFDGLMAFQAIRDATAPESYSWEVKLAEGETLQLIDDHNAGIFWGDGTQALLIRAQSAHGADGKAVTTSLSVSGGNVITLKVNHRATGVVYPVVAGVGWEGGFQYQETTIQQPPPPPDEKELIALAENPVMMDVYVGSPEAVATSSGIFGPDPTKPWAVDICPRSLLGTSVCDAWKVRFKGYFRYNYKEAYYPDKDPKCLPSSNLIWSVDITECAWVGPNHQPYRDGYHITSRAQWQATVDPPVGPSVTSHKALTGRAYGSGNIYFHDTADICNPNTSC